MLLSAEAIFSECSTAAAAADQESGGAATAAVAAIKILSFCDSIATCGVKNLLYFIIKCLKRKELFSLVAPQTDAGISIRPDCAA